MSRLESLVRRGQDTDLFRVNPLRYAATHGLQEEEAIDLFLHATRGGLFDMDWILVCASCGNVFNSFRSLERLDPHFVCDLCSMENEADLDDYIQVAFTVSPRVKDVVFHDPARLSPEELYFRYHRSEDVESLPIGQTIVEIFREWTVLVDYLSPGESKTVEFELVAGMGVSDVLNSASALYLVDPDADPRSTNVSLEVTDAGLRDMDREFEPFSLDFPTGSFRYPASARIPAGPISLTVHNVTARRCSAWVVNYRWIPEELPLLTFQPMLSAKRLLSTQTFRTLFRAETLPASEALQIRDLTYLFTDLTDSTAMYDAIGDANAYNLVRLHFETLVDAVRRNHGAVVKTIGDAVMATFPDPADAVTAAFDMLADLADFNRTTSSELILKIGIHRGRSIAVNLNDRVDYFGQSVNIAARVQGLAGAGEMTLSEDVYRYPGVEEALSAHEVMREPGIMKGVAEALPVYHVRPAAS